MSQYGSAGNLSLGGRGASPSYASLGRHQDDYNRFETKRHHETAEQRNSQEASKFSGYGDRPGSGVEMTGHYWTGGEIITSPEQLPRSLKPRRMFYSPIGDGVVAADGIEKKRGPVDLSPRVTITTLSKIDRGERGQGGVHVYEKEWSNTLPGEAAAGQTFDGTFPPLGADSGRASVQKPPTPAPEPARRTISPPLPRPDSGRHSAGLGLDSGYNKQPAPAYIPPAYTAPEPEPRPASAASTFDPYRIVDTKTGYLITNPRELIHQYATTTPIAVMDLNEGTPVTKTMSVKSMYHTLETTETQQQFAPYAPYRSQQKNGNASGTLSPSKFVRNLRDETMTHSQREANTHLDPLNQRDPNASSKIQNIRQQTMPRGGYDDIDQLTQQLVEGFRF